MTEQETKTSAAKLAANARWAKKNKETAYFNRDKSTAKSFINKKADEANLIELRGLIDARLAEMEEMKMEKVFFRNVNSGEVLSEKDYNALIDREAESRWDAMKDDDYEKEALGVTNFAEFKAYLIRNGDSDFVQCNEDGSDIDWANY